MSVKSSKGTYSLCEHTMHEGVDYYFVEVDVEYSEYGAGFFTSNIWTFRRGCHCWVLWAGDTGCGRTNRSKRLYSLCLHNCHHRHHSHPHSKIQGSSAMQKGNEKRTQCPKYLSAVTNSSGWQALETESESMGGTLSGSFVYGLGESVGHGIRIC